MVVRSKDTRGFCHGTTEHILKNGCPQSMEESYEESRSSLSLSILIGVASIKEGSAIHRGGFCGKVDKRDSNVR